MNGDIQNAGAGDDDALRHSKREHAGLAGAASDLFKRDRFDAFENFENSDGVRDCFAVVLHFWHFVHCYQFAGF